MTRELKPCPFCGGKARIVHHSKFGSDYSAVECMSCRAVGEEFSKNYLYSSDEQAIESWNRRVSENDNIKQPSWMYDIPFYAPEYNELFEKVEKALCFKLFTWQKTYIINEEYRRSGRTTAEILRKLLVNEHNNSLNVDDCYIDFSFPYVNEYEKWFRREVVRIKRILDEHGVKTKPIVTNSVDRRKLLDGILEEKENDKCLD